MHLVIAGGKACKLRLVSNSRREVGAELHDPASQVTHDGGEEHRCCGQIRKWMDDLRVGTPLTDDAQQRQQQDLVQGKEAEDLRPRMSGIKRDQGPDLAPL